MHGKHGDIVDISGKTNPLVGHLQIAKQGPQKDAAAGSNRPDQQPLENEDPFQPAGKKGGKGTRRPAPTKDETLYDL